MKAKAEGSKSCKKCEEEKQKAKELLEGVTFDDAVNNMFSVNI